MRLHWGLECTDGMMYSTEDSMRKEQLTIRQANKQKTDGRLAAQSNRKIEIPEKIGHVA
jgi:hypothetical protein